MPEVHGDAQLRHQRQQIRILDPAGQRRRGLGGEIDDRAVLRRFAGFGLEDAADHVQPLVGVDHDGGRVVGVEAGERGMRTIGVESGESLPLVDEVLGQNARGNRFSDAAFFATDEVE